SRRRHTRFSRDWSSDVCSSDLESKLAHEITEINLSYLILAQQLIRADRPTALFRLGVCDEVADLIDSLKPSQMLKVASGNALMRSEEHTSELQSRENLVCRLLL